MKVLLKMLVFAAALAAACPSAFAQAGRIRLRTMLKSEVSTSFMRSFLDEGFSDNELTQDGDLLVRRSGINTYIRVDEGKALLMLRTSWGASDSISENRAARIVNRWNREHVFSTATCDEERFMLRYYMTYEGGLSAENLNDSLLWFFSIAEGFGKYLDEEDAI